MTNETITLNEDEAAEELLPLRGRRTYGARAEEPEAPAYVLDDKILPIGASMFARIVENRLPAGRHA